MKGKIDIPSECDRNNFNMLKNKIGILQIH